MTDLLANATNPSIGIMLFTLGGLAGAIFYMPLKKVKNWAWESYWMIYAVFGLLIVPWILAFTMSPNVIEVIKAAPGKELLYCALCGAAWGFGGLTWGLMIRYLGVGLGLALGCGICSAAGTLLPPMLKGSDAISAMFGTSAGLVSVLGALVSVAGIVLVGMAGMSKENELPEEEKKKAVAEFNFKKGIIAVLFSGLMSSAMSFGLQGGGAIESLALTTEPMTAVAWKGMPVLVVVLFGGFLVNFTWCVLLNIKNKTGGDYIKPEGPVLLANIVFAGLAGTIWCSQFICFKTGEPQMGKTSYIGWAVLMASAIMFSQILGLFLGEWKGTSKKTIRLLVAGLVLLVVSAVVAGYSGHLGSKASETPDAPVAMFIVDNV
jgi:L-rhamnose-H+ transport protein